MTGPPAGATLAACPTRLSLEKLKRNRGYALILAFVVSALIGPPNAIWMSTLALSMYLLFEIGLFVSGLFRR